MKIAIFENDRQFAERLEAVVCHCTHHPAAINTGDADEIIGWFERTAEPVLFLLDIVAGGKTVGFQIARRIFERNNGSLVVFVTANPDRVLYRPTFKAKAFSIILKNPCSWEREIKETIALAKRELRAKSVYIHTGKFETLYIPHETICYIESIKNSNKLRVHCTEGQYVIRETLKSLQEQLAPFGFVRCHKSIIVNVANIRKKDKTAKVLVFHNGASCPYSHLLKGAALYNVKNVRG